MYMCIGVLVEWQFTVNYYNNLAYTAKEWYTTYVISFLAIKQLSKSTNNN